MSLPEINSLPKEADVLINGVSLTSAQVMALRVSVSNFLTDLNNKEYFEALGDCAYGYQARSRELIALLIRSR